MSAYLEVIREVGRRSIDHKTLIDPSFPPREIDIKSIPANLIKYFFDLQSQIESEGGMDYIKYGPRLLKGLGVEANPLQEATFTRDIIVGLQAIPMADNLYPGIVDNMPWISQNLYFAEMVALWSQGDATATGYQHTKIFNTRVVRQLASNLPQNKRRDFLANNTRYMVGDTKLADFEGYVRSLPVRHQKVVVVEDSVNNLAKTGKIVSEINDKRPTVHAIRFTPVWAAYSREGIEAFKKMTLGDFSNQIKRLNAVVDPEEFASNRLAEIVKGAHVFIDADGVIVNNLTQRDYQAKVKAWALCQLHGAKTPQQRETVLAELSSRLAA